MINKVMRDSFDRFIKFHKDFLKFLIKWFLWPLSALNTLLGGKNTPFSVVVYFGVFFVGALAFFLYFYVAFLAEWNWAGIPVLGSFLYYAFGTFLVKIAQSLTDHDFDHIWYC